MKKALVAFCMLFGSASLCVASEQTYKGDFVNTTVAASTNWDFDMNLNSVDAAAIQVTYSSANPSAISFKDGTTSTGSITINSLTGLTTAYATNKITIASNTALSGAVLTVNGQPLIEGRLWNYNVNYASNTTVSLLNALNLLFSNTFVSTAATGGTVIFSTATNYGSAGNSITVVSSTQAALTVNSATFTGGLDNATVNIDNYPFVFNKDVYPGASTALTATALAAAINASAEGQITSAQAIGSVVYTTSTMTGYNVNLRLSVSTSAMTVSGAAMTGGTASDITLSAASSSLAMLSNYSYLQPFTPRATSTIFKVPTGLGTAFPLRYNTVSGTAPAPLVNGTTYYASNLTATSFQLADTSTGAVAGVTISITTHTKTGGGRFTLTPTPLAGTPTFKLQVSNDGTTFTDLLPYEGIVNFASPYTAGAVFYQVPTTLWRWLRLAYTNGTGGGVNIKESINGKKM